MHDVPNADTGASRYLFISPRLVIEDVNMCAGALVWGFPSISAFVGFSVALERSPAAQRHGVTITGVGVVHHDHTHHVYGDPFVKMFCLTRNPLDKSGKTPGIVEEGRMRLEASFVFELEFKGGAQPGLDEARTIGDALWQQMLQMRVCGGRPHAVDRGLRRPIIEPISSGADGSEQETHAKQMRRLSRNLLPGFALVSRAGLLAGHTACFKVGNPEATSLDAFLDLCRWSSRSIEKDGKVQWEKDARKGWLVPIGVGFSAISKKFAAGEVKGARDDVTPLVVAEPVYSLGEFIAPHRIRSLESLLWRLDIDALEEHRLYIAKNDHELVHQARSDMASAALEGGDDI